MRKHLIAPALALVVLGSACLGLFVYDRFYSRSQPGAGAPPASGHPPDLAPPQPSAAPPTAPGHAAARPEKLSEVTVTPTLTHSLQQLGPRSFELLDYRLGFLARFSRCLANRVSSRGWVDLDFVFELPSVDGKLALEGVGSYVSFIDSDDLRGGSQLSAGDTALVLECSKQAHFNFRINFRHPIQEPQFHWRPSFYLPIDDNDLAYKLARTGTWK